MRCNINLTGIHGLYIYEQSICCPWCSSLLNHLPTVLKMKWTAISPGDLEWTWMGYTNILPVTIFFFVCFFFLFSSSPFLKTAGGIVLGSVAVSAVSAVSTDVLLYISVAVKASFLKLGMCNICKNNIAKMFLDFFKILNCAFDRGF